MQEEPHLGAVFPDQAHAEAAVEQLREHGLADEHLGVAVHAGDTYALEKDVGGEVAHGLERGIAIGAPVGAVAGITALGLIVSGLGVIGVGGVLAVGGVTGALAGGFWGAYLGLKSEEPAVWEELDWESIPLDPGQVLVVIAGHGHPREILDILERHGGKVVERPSDHSWMDELNP